MTTYRSESRGFEYSAPPSGDEANRTRPEFEDADEANADETASSDVAETDATEVASESEATATGERGSPTLDPMSATTDANWTGNVPADD
jgi:hypothetical protein